MGFELPELEYAYDALEPHIDAETMELHHSKHHAGYTANLNAAIDGTEMDEMSEIVFSFGFRQKQDVGIFCRLVGRRPRTPPFR